MSIETLPVPAPLSAPSNGASDLVHDPCCRDDSVALCGTDVTDQPYTCKPIDCVLCVLVHAEIELNGRCGACCPLIAAKEKY